MLNKRSKESTNDALAAYCHRDYKNHEQDGQSRYTHPIKIGVKFKHRIPFPDIQALLGPLHEQVYRYWLAQLPQAFSDGATFFEFFQADRKAGGKSFTENNFLRHHSLSQTASGDWTDAEAGERLPFILLHNVTTVLAALHGIDSSEVRGKVKVVAVRRTAVPT